MVLSYELSTYSDELRFPGKNIPCWPFPTVSEPQKLDDLPSPVVPSDLSSAKALDSPSARLVTVECITVDILSGFVLIMNHLAKVRLLSREKPTPQNHSIKGSLWEMDSHGTG